MVTKSNRNPFGGHFFGILNASDRNQSFLKRIRQAPGGLIFALKSKHPFAMLHFYESILILGSWGWQLFAARSDRTAQRKKTVKLKGRVALVTGGARAIGRSHTLRLARLGADLEFFSLELCGYPPNLFFDITVKGR
jgi:hypothetical protein